MADHFDNLRPKTIIGTIAAAPARLRASFTHNPQHKPSEVAKIVGDDGQSMLDIVATTTKIVTETRYEISAAANRDNAVLGRRAIDPLAIAPAKATGDRDEEIDKLTEATEKLIEVMSVMSATDWGRISEVDGSEPVSVEKVGQGIARMVFAQIAKAEKLGVTV